MKMSARVGVAATLLTLGAAPLAAQETLKVPAIASGAPHARAGASKARKPVDKPAPSARKPGELEGWTRGADNSDGKARSGRRDQSPPDGGLPLPTARSTETEPGVGFDKSGNFSTGVKF